MPTAKTPLQRLEGNDSMKCNVKLSDKLPSKHLWCLQHQWPQGAPFGIRPSALGKPSPWTCLSTGDSTEQNWSSSHLISSLFCHVWKLGRISATLLRSWFLLSSLSLSFFVSNRYCLHAFNAFSLSRLKENRNTRNKVTMCRCVHDITGNLKENFCSKGEFTSWGFVLSAASQGCHMLSIYVQTISLICQSCWGKITNCPFLFLSTKNFALLTGFISWCLLSTLKMKRGFLKNKQGLWKKFL